MQFELIYLLLGLAGLWIGAKLLIGASLRIAKHFKISPMFIGLTIVAIGTDLPELFITITGSIQKLQGLETSGLVMGDIIGSCITQIALVLGILSLIGITTVKKRELLRDGMMMLGSVAILFLAGLDGKITKAEGIILIIIYLFYFITIFREEKFYEKINNNHNGWFSIMTAFFSLIAGIAVLVFSSKLVVDSSVELAIMWGVSQSFVGIIIIGLGTSLPELSVSIGALFRKVPELSIGSLLGSNIFDSLFVLGAGSAISGFNISKDLLKWDIPILFFISLIVLIFLKTRMKLDKREAIILIGIYVSYVLFKLVML